METVGSAIVIMIGVSSIGLLWGMHFLNKTIIKELSGIKQSLDKILRHLEEKNDKKSE